MPSLHLRLVSSEESEVKVLPRVYVRHFSQSLVQHAMRLTAVSIVSGEGFFVSEISGQGTLWVQAIGAIVQRHLRPGEEWIVDNGHLVAWSAQYKVETIKAKGGLLSKLHTDEGKVCR